MQRESWQTAKDLFRLAIDQPPAERTAFVTAQCGDESVRAEVLRLLHFHDEPSEFLVSPMEPEPATLDREGDSLIGRTLGGFLIVRRIGMGGMGAVYEALQDQPRRHAAVKILRPGIFAPRMQRRFEYESEILAKLTHPGIAQVFAAGTFEIGGGAQPWFAMELIEGPSIQAYVKSHTLSLTRKLDLLLSICDAIQHAHQRGVVHRDLKPDNILMTSAAPDANAGRPKILDFGVARLIDADVQVSMHTSTGEIVGTLSYMSPEQLSGNPERIDARCDVFALGVIAYELLSGRLPHGAGRSSFAEVIRAIEHDEPTRLGAIDPALRGDLEVILAKALEKDVDSRYQSAAELAADLRRYMNNEPVLARPATVMYQLKKFARRNRALAGGILTTLLALVTGVLLYAHEARTARREADKSRYEADKATAINNFMTNDFMMKLLAAANSPDAAQRLPVAGLVEEASERVGTMFAGQPLMEAAVRNEIGTVHYNLGTIDQAATQFERALELWESQLGPDHPDTLKAVNNLGQTRARQRRPDEAEALYRRAMDGRRRALGEDDPYTLVTMNNLAELCRSAGRLDEAEAMLRHTLESQKRVQGDGHKNTITTLGNLAALLMQRGRNDEALVLLRQAHDASLATLGGDHIMTAMTGVRLAGALQRTGQPAEAERILLAAVESLDRSLGAEHPETINARRALANTYRQQSKREQAANQLRRALDGARAKPKEFAKLATKIQKELDDLSNGPAPSGVDSQPPAAPKGEPDAPLTGPALNGV